MSRWEKFPYLQGINHDWAKATTLRALPTTSDYLIILLWPMKQRRSLVPVENISFLKKKKKAQGEITFQQGCDGAAAPILLQWMKGYIQGQQRTHGRRESRKLESVWVISNIILQVNSQTPELSISRRLLWEIINPSLVWASASQTLMCIWVIWGLGKRHLLI